MSYRVFRLLLIVTVLLLWSVSLHAQEPTQDPPLSGPVLGANTVQQDEIILYDVLNDHYRTLSFGNQDHHLWDFSSDGCRILFTLGDATQPPKLYTAALDGSDLTPLVQYDDLPPTEWGILEATWQPDGDIIAAVMLRQQAGTETYHIAYVDEAGGVPDFYSVSGLEFSPRWSPEGDFLAYISYEDRAAGADIYSTAVPTVEPVPGQTPVPITWVSEADLWLVRADGEEKFRRTSFLTGSVSEPRWSPDGETIAFVHAPAGGIDTIWIIGREESARPAQLSFQGSLLLDMTWLPDSTAIIAALRDFRDMQMNRLWQVPLVGRADDAGFLYLDGFGLTHADFPRFSPDGRWLAVRSAYDLALVDLPARSTALLEERTAGNTPPVWSPDGFSDERDC